MKLQANEARGFTLIELLVVIAIIGLLSSIVLASLGAARNKAKNASAMESMVSMRAEAELTLDQASGTYPSTLCTGTSADGTLGAPLTTLAQAVATNVVAPACRRLRDSVGAGRTLSWAAHVVLLENGGTFCVDSNGFSGLLAGDINSEGGVSAEAGGGGSAAGGAPAATCQ